MSVEAFVCDAIRTPFGRCAGALSSVRTECLGAKWLGVGQGIGLIVERV